MSARVRIGNARSGGWWWRLPILAIIWLAFAAPVVTFFIGASVLRTWAKDLPEVPDLSVWRANAPQTSLIVSADGSHLAEPPFKDAGVVGRRTLVVLDDVPQVAIKAVLAAEDVRFFTHKGYDPQAILRALRVRYEGGRRQGASTITQQLARNLLPVEIGTEQSFRRKTREALMARKIERRWTKPQILETYLNYVYFGHGAYGLAAAARAYFDEEVDQLTLAQSALIAGLIQAPSTLDPWNKPERARARRDEILARMLRASLIDESTRASASAEAIALKAPHSVVRVSWYTEQVRRFIGKALPDDFDRGGLIVETAANVAQGEQLQHDVDEHASKWNDAEAAAIVWDHQSGYIEALVGGRTVPHDVFDRAIQSCRQPGSAFKAILYGAALETGAITPGTPLRDAPIAEYDEETNVHWKPKSGEHFRGIVLAQDAIAASLNAPAIDVFDRTGPDAIIKLARRLGITSQLDPVRPMALGASCVKPFELAHAYAVIARRGWAVAPRFVVRVRRGDDTMFDAAVPEDPWLDSARRFDRVAATAGMDPAERVGAEGGRLIDETTVFQLQDMLAAVVDHGTGSGAKMLGRPAAGKTGTTNDNTDAWFIGFTGRALAAVWVGFDDPLHKLGPEGDGRRAALPLWVRAIRTTEADRPRVPVPGPPPGGMDHVTIDRETGLRAADGAGGLPLWFKAGTAPSETAGAPGTSATDFGESSRQF
ncbi:MAG TPA: transglycosylase domain-containing protein [Kofleriaceae bacterium]